MISILTLDILSNRERLRKFSQLDHSESFRYFKNRVFDEAISTHIHTILYTEDDKDIGYAHIDYDKASQRAYLGICVVEGYQGRGIGKKLIDILLKVYSKDIYLTVDKTNLRAIHLYEKNGFMRIETRETLYVYLRNAPLMLPVSIGEAVDKLSILDIKIQKISDKVKQESCKEEFHAILPYIKSFVDKNIYLYNCMIYINRLIWDLQDSIRSTPNEVNSGEILHEILDLNDMRFRIKKRLNLKVSSGLQEQKGYSKRVGLFVGHLGLGDILNMAGAIRYCALDVDLLYVVCKKRYCTTVQELFLDDPYIQIVECSDDDREVPSIIKAGSINGNSITQKYLSGIWSGKSINTNLPFSFYDTLGLPYEIRKLFFFVKPVNELELPKNEYIFTHAGTSNTKNKTITHNWDIDTTLTIDPNTNHYPVGHTWHTIAEGYVNKPFLQYKRLLENAKEIHVTDSSFYCLTCFLNCTASKKVCYDRNTGECSKEYFFQ
jgi:GNAT superfamily N-acetyltransferase